MLTGFTHLALEVIGTYLYHTCCVLVLSPCAFLLSISVAMVYILEKDTEKVLNMLLVRFRIGILFLVFWFQK